MCACRPPQGASGVDAAVNSVLLAPQHPEHLIVCNRSPTIFVLTTQVEDCCGPEAWDGLCQGFAVPLLLPNISTVYG
jgi:hypothetical protein